MAFGRIGSNENGSMDDGLNGAQGRCIIIIIRGGEMQFETFEWYTVNGVGVGIVDVENGTQCVARSARWGVAGRDEDRGGLVKREGVHEEFALRRMHQPTSRIHHMSHRHHQHHK